MKKLLINFFKFSTRIFLKYLEISTIMVGVLSYLDGLNCFEKRSNLREASKLMASLDNLQNNFKIIRVVGDQGNTANFVASILQKSGHKVGLHSNGKELVKANGKKVDSELLLKLAKTLKRKVARNEIKITSSEFKTALALLYFSQTKMDYVVVKNDVKSNVINHLTPEVNVIAANSLEDKSKLAKMIKRDALVVVAEKDKSILKLFSQTCQQKNSKMFVVSDYLTAKNKKSESNGHCFNVCGKPYSINLPGKNEVENALTAMLAVNFLDEIPHSKIQAGLERVR